MILEESLVGSPLVQIVWQRLQHTQKGRRGMCSDTHNPGGEVRGCCVGCILDMPEISPSVFIAASYELQGILDRVSVLWHWEVSELPSQFYLIPCSLWTVPFHCLFPEFPGGATPLKTPYIGG